MFLTMTAAWGPMITDFPSRKTYEQYLIQEADHPFTGERIRALGKEVYDNPRLFLFRQELRGEMRDVERPTPENIARVRRYGTTIIKLGDLVDDEAYQRGLAIRGIGTDLERLKPRSPGHSFVRSSSWSAQIELWRCAACPAEMGDPASIIGVSVSQFAPQLR